MLEQRKKIRYRYYSEFLLFHLRCSREPEPSPLLGLRPKCPGAALVTLESWGRLSHLASLDQLGTLGLGLTGGRHVGDAHQLEQGLALLHMLLTHLNSLEETGNNKINSKYRYRC